VDRAKTLAFLGIAALLAACSSEPRIVVGSKNFTEQLVLGEILAQQIERRLGTRVDRRLNLGGTLLAHQALVDGEIDLYPEYTGTALMAILDLPAIHDADAVRRRVATAYRDRFRIEWLPPFGFNNSFVMVVPGELARAHGMATLSDAAASGVTWSLGMSYEFEGRPDGLPALNRAYNLTWGDAPKTMDLGLLYQALQQGQVTMVAANGTDGLLSARDVTVLDDDQSAFPPYQAAVAVRAAALADHPGLQAALEELSGRIDAATMRQLNFQADSDHRPIDEVAAGFLAGIED
jgi:glycine betaine/choline ABC-type transport system substrate-binding protein